MRFKPRSCEITALLLGMDEKSKPGPKPVEIMINEPWHEAYVDYLADPHDRRTQGQWIDDNQVNERTFFRWKAKFREQIYAEANRKLNSRKTELKIKGWKKLEQLMDENGSTALKALELFFKLNGELIDRVESKSEILTPEDKKQKLAEALSRISANVEKRKKKEQGEDKPDTPND